MSAGPSRFGLRSASSRCRSPVLLVSLVLVLACFAAPDGRASTSTSVAGAAARDSDLPALATVVRHCRTVRVKLKRNGKVVNRNGKPVVRRVRRCRRVPSPGCRFVKVRKRKHGKIVKRHGKPVYRKVERCPPKPTQPGPAPGPTATPTPTATSSGRILPPSDGGSYWGAWVGQQFTGGEAPWDWNAVTAFETVNSASKRVSVLNFSSPFSASDCRDAGWCTFASTPFTVTRNNGALPFFSWAPAPYTPVQVASGAADSYIRDWAAAAKSWGHPFFLRFAWEMNGAWFPWGVGHNGITSSDYVAMWRHVHDIFEGVGATQATWVWCPNIDTSGTLASLASVYPGASYVDWTCLNGYNGNDPWRSFADLYRSTYDRIVALAPGKPMIVGEVASTETGGSKAQWIADMFAALPGNFPAIRGLMWFDKIESGPGGYSDWRLETSTTSSDAFARGIASSGFKSNEYAATP